MDIDGIKKLWLNGTEESWEKACDIYRLKVSDENWEFETKHHADDVLKMDADAFYLFLINYYKWKYNGNYLFHRIKGLRFYEAENKKEDLISIRNRLFHDYDLDDTDGLLRTAMEINGLGVAGASGLLAILFPNHYGTVDKFVILALKEIDDFLGFPDIREKVLAMNPDYIRIKDAVTLEKIFRMKANKLNEEFSNTEWTPKRIDMVLWAYRTKQKSGWSRIVFGKSFYGD